MVVFVWQTTGVELLLKCVNIPETNDSVVSPGLVSFSCLYYTAYNFTSNHVELRLNYAECGLSTDTLLGNQPWFKFLYYSEIH